MIPTPMKDFIYGFCGTFAPIVAVVTSYQEQVEFNLRIGSLLLGMLASIAYIISVIRKTK
jgi:hypothetical protein